MARWSHPVMHINRNGMTDVQNPRVAYASWLMLNFVPTPEWDELELRLDEIQKQAVHMTAIKLRESGMTDAADLIDPGES